LFSGGARAQLLSEEQVRQFRLHLGFPGVFGAVLGHALTPQRLLMLASSFISISGSGQ